MNDPTVPELMQAAFFIFCCLLVVAGFAAWLIGFVRFHRPLLGAPHRSVFRAGSIERFREELKRGVAEPRRDELEFTDDTLPVFLKRQAD